MRKKHLTEILNRHDPMGLLAIGCPADEYWPEVDRLVADLHADMSAEEISSYLDRLFAEMFARHRIPKTLCDAMAADIFPLFR
jgi:hypothetical protein